MLKEKFTYIKFISTKMNKICYWRYLENRKEIKYKIDFYFTFVIAIQK